MLFWGSQWASGWSQIYVLQWAAEANPVSQAIEQLNELN